MRISEMIKKLETYKKQYGDHIIYKDFNISNYAEPVTSIKFYGGQRCLLTNTQEEIIEQEDSRYYENLEWLDDCDDSMIENSMKHYMISEHKKGEYYKC